ncbi:hypothetical protein VNI00_010348 [Paramarasmius palmivorus]|uniref:Uncharacterized protein n=1 Tax=Paramarasmius palmivorus TaxID=297713 RepID=A0AAW0CJI9_9AGAR
MSSYPSSSALTLEQLSPTTSSSTTPTTPTLMNIPNNSSTSLAPSGAAVPLLPPDARQGKVWANSGSFGERRGYSYTISFEETKPISQATAAKGHLEPRAGSLPRRSRKKVPAPAPPKVVKDKGFNLVVQRGTSSDDSDVDE